MAKDSGAKPWTEGEGPSRETLVAAIRTLVSMASCWLDRDSEARGIDSKQRERLEQVVALLAEAATVQREDADDRLLICFRDDLAMALGAAHRPVPGGHELTERAAKAGQVATVVPGGLSTVGVVWRPAASTPAAVGRLAHAIAAGFADLRLNGYAGPLAIQFNDGVAPEQATALAKAALVQRTPKKFDDAWTPVAVANGIVDQILGRAVKLEAGGPRGDTAAEARYGRILARRHADRLIPTRVDVDLGAYFGARFARSAKSAKASVAQVRAWAVARLIAEVCDAGLDLADELFEAQPDMRTPWQVWHGSATGTPLRPPGHFDPAQLRQAMDEYWVGGEPRRPADREPPLDGGVDGCDLRIRLALQSPAALRPTWNLFFRGELDWPDVLNTLDSDAEFAATIERAALHMMHSPCDNPQQWLQAAAEVIAPQLGGIASSSGRDQVLKAACACAIILEITRSCHQGKGLAACRWFLADLAQKQTKASATS